MWPGFVAARLAVARPTVSARALLVWAFLLLDQLSPTRSRAVHPDKPTGKPIQPGKPAARDVHPDKPTAKPVQPGKPAARPVQPDKPTRPFQQENPPGSVQAN